MGKRVGLLAGLLVLTLGSGAVAQSQSPSPSPEATPLFAPGDMASLLPTRVGDVEVQVVWAGSGLSSLDSRDAEFWQVLLAGLGKDADDIRAASGVGVPPGGLAPDDIPLFIWALRIEGVPADTWAESFWDLTLKVLLAGGLPDKYVSGWRDIDGRDVYSVVWTPEELAEWRALDPSMQVPDDTGHWLYPVGEVLFWVGIPLDWPVPIPSIEDVMAELP